MVTYCHACFAASTCSAILQNGGAGPWRWRLGEEFWCWWCCDYFRDGVGCCCCGRCGTPEIQEWDKNKKPKLRAVLTRSQDQSLKVRAIHNLGGEVVGIQRVKAAMVVGSGQRQRRRRVQGLWWHVIGVMRESGRRTLGRGSEGRSDERCATQSRHSRKATLRQCRRARVADRGRQRRSRKRMAMSGLHEGREQNLAHGTIKCAPLSLSRPSTSSILHPPSMTEPWGIS